MHHAIAVKGVVAVFWLMDRIGAVAEIGTQQVFGQLAFHTQTSLGEFKRSRGIHTMQIGVIEPINPWLGMLELGNAANTSLCDRIRRQV